MIQKSNGDAETNAVTSKVGRICFVHFMIKDNYNLVEQSKIEKLCIM